MAEAVEAGEDFVEDDWEAGPGSRFGVGVGFWSGKIGGREGVGADYFDEGTLEKRVADQKLVTSDVG